MDLPGEIARLPKLATVRNQVNMGRQRMALAPRQCSWNNRKGTVVLLAAFTLALLLTCLAFAVDVGMLCVVRTQAQRCADAAALAGAWAMVNEDRVRGQIDEVHAAARQEAVKYAALQEVNGECPALDANELNDPGGQIVIGRLDNPADRTEALSFEDPHRYNAVQVRVACTAEQDNPVPMFFARILGLRTAAVAAQATAIFDGGNTVGFRVTEKTGNATLMPFAVKRQDWEGLLAEGGGDRWTWDPATETVSRGSDGKPELNIFPVKQQESGRGSGVGITPGNFGTVDVGNPNNSASDLVRQIREGISAEDLAWYDGELKLDATSGTLLLNGDTGMSASMRHALADVVGQPRTVLLYDEVSGQGNQTWFRIVGFAGVRIVDFKLSGKEKYVLVQPALVVDDAAIPGEPDSSYFVGQPVHLAR
jgi:hypothetical protein